MVQKLICKVVHTQQVLYWNIGHTIVLVVNSACISALLYYV